MGNVAYILMQNLGFEFGIAFGISPQNALTVGLWVARFTGLSMFLALTGAFFTLTYSPLKTLIQGSPKEVWPGNLAKIDDGIPLNSYESTSNYSYCINITYFIWWKRCWTSFLAFSSND